MAHLRDLIVNGNSRTFGTAYATKFEGPLTGNATSATKATQDGDGNTITSTYATASSLSSHTGNKSNPHSVTKAQVGLGSVANYDQSKAIKSITRSGTTFTATALDGTTTTFTQQDTNTTYNIASSSSNGLMSADDKKKLDSIASGAQVNSITGVKGDSETTYRTGNVNITKANIGLSNVENKSSATIRGELTKANVTTALGYTPPTTNTTYGIATSTTAGLIKSGGDVTVDATSGTISINDNSHSHTISNISGLQSALDSKLNTSLKGARNGLASLDANGTVPASQLPSYVDDVVDVSMKSDLTSATNANGDTITPETSKIYIDDIGTSATNKTYRWSGTKYVVISETLALGETSSTAFDGARGKVAYNHSQAAHARVDATNTKASTTNGHISINGTDTTVYTHPSYTAHNAGFYKVTVDSQGHVSGATAVTKADITALGIPGQDTNTTYGVVSSSSNGLMSPTMLNTLNSVNSAIGGKYSSSGGTLNGNLSFPDIGDTGESKGIVWSGSTDGAKIYYKTAAADKGQLVLHMDDDGDTTINFEWNAGGGVSTKSYITSDGVYHGTATYANSAGSANNVAWANVTGKPATYYTHPSYTSHASGLYKVSVDSQGHVSGATAVTKEDITALGIPGQDTNTTYVKATSSADGLMSAADKAKLDGVASGANKYTHPGYTAHSAGFYKVTVDSQGHVSGATAVTKADITALGIPGQDTNTTYGIATSTTAGLVKSGGNVTVNTNGTMSVSYASSAGSASAVAWANISGKPSTYTPSSHTHSIQNITELSKLKAGSSSTWGNQTGTAIVSLDDPSGGSIILRQDNPSTGQLSMLVDGTVYVNEGRNAVISTADIGNQSVKYATTAGSANAVAWGNISGKPSTYTPSSHTHTIAQVTNLQSSLDAKINRSGDTMTGALNLANGIKNKVGDDVAIGDFNQSGSLGIQGLNGTTTVSLIAQGANWDSTTSHMDMVYNTTDQCCDFKFK